MKAKRYLWLLISLLLIPLGMQSQSHQPDSALVDSVLADLFFDEPDLYDLFDGNTRFHFLYVGTTFNSATYYIGRQVGENYVNMSGQLYYFISNGLYFGASGVWYSHLDPGFRSTVVTAGYSNSVPGFDHLRYRISYNRYIYMNMGTDFEPEYTSDINGGLTFKYKFLGVRGDYTLLMGNDYSSVLSTDVFAKIKLLTLSKYDRIQFEPEFSFNYGTETVEYDLNAHLAETDPFYEPNYVLKEEFGLMSTELALPITVGYRNFDFEVAYIHHFPYSLDPAYYYEKSGSWRISLAYIISVN